jgi:hypothetical protein
MLHEDNKIHNTHKCTHHAASNVCCMAANMDQTLVTLVAGKQPTAAYRWHQHANLQQSTTKATTPPTTCSAGCMVANY